MVTQQFGCESPYQQLVADEALWRARIHPERQANTLTAREITRLHEAIPAVLRRAVKRGADFLTVGWKRYGFALLFFGYIQGLAWFSFIDFCWKCKKTPPPEDPRQ